MNPPYVNGTLESRLNYLDQHWRNLVSEYTWHRCHPAGTRLPLREPAAKSWQQLNAFMSLDGLTPQGFDDVIYEELRQASLIHPESAAAA